LLNLSFYLYLLPENGFHTSQNMQQAINWYKCSCDWPPYTSFSIFVY